MSMDSTSESSNNPSGEIMLFGVRVKVDPMRKSVSLNDLSNYEIVGNKKVMKNVVSGYVSADDAVVVSHQSSVGIRERKRGVPWTEDEHKLFLLGLQRVGKGDWRGISRNFVKTRTPTQVASHAQKYFLRRSNINQRRRRSSLFDITTDSVPSIPMEEKVHQENKGQPLLSPAQLPLVEMPIINGPQVFPVNVCPVPMPANINNSMEKLTFRHLGHINHHDSAEISHQVPVFPIPAQRMVDLNLNQRFSEEPSPLSLNLSLSLDQVQDQFSRHSGYEINSSFSNGDSSMISVA